MVDSNRYPTREEFKEMQDRVRKMEDYVFAAKILSALLAMISAAVVYVAQNWMSVKEMILHILGAK